MQKAPPATNAGGLATWIFNVTSIPFPRRKKEPAAS